MPVRRGGGPVQAPPGFRRRMVVDAVRGVTRIRKWPEPFGPPRSAIQAYWQQWFKQANRLARYVADIEMKRAIELAKGTPHYPRDLLIAAMRGSLYHFYDEDGNHWLPYYALVSVSESLDVIGNAPGVILARGPDLWLPVSPGAAGRVLTSNGPTAVPTFEPGGGGGGGLALLDHQTISGAATLEFTTGFSSLYDAYRIEFSLLPATDDVLLFGRVSQDGGSSWLSGANDYSYTIRRYFTNGSSGQDASTGDNKMQWGKFIGNANDEGVNGALEFRDPLSGTRRKTFDLRMELCERNGLEGLYTGMSALKNNNNSINGVQFSISSGNIASGWGNLYGYKNS